MAEETLGGEAKGHASESLSGATHRNCRATDLRSGAWQRNSEARSRGDGIAKMSVAMAWPGKDRIGVVQQMARHSRALRWKGIVWIGAEQQRS